jgi:hypothetical protein
MKKIILYVFMAITLFAAEPIQYGAYYGDVKEKMSNINNYPDNDVSSAGNVYLYKQKIDLVNYIYDTKIKHIKSGLKSAKSNAIKNKAKYFAIDNVTHQVIITENKVVITTDYNVLSFD